MNKGSVRGKHEIVMDTYHPIKLSIGNADVTTQPISRLKLDRGTAYTATAIRTTVSVAKSPERNHRTILFLSYRTYTKKTIHLMSHEGEKEVDSPRTNKTSSTHMSKDWVKKASQMIQPRQIPREKPRRFPSLELRTSSDLFPSVSQSRAETGQCGNSRDSSYTEVTDISIHPADPSLRLAGWQCEGWSFILNV